MRAVVWQVFVAGTVGGVAMIPVGIVLRFWLGQSINVYGQLVVERLLGRVTTGPLLLEHALVSWGLAIPLVLIMGWVRGLPPLVLGLAYGAAIWFLINSLLLPLAFGRPTAWQIGWPAIWPSLSAHLVYGVFGAMAVRRAIGRGGPDEGLAP